MRYLIAAAVALATMAGWAAWQQDKGVQKERASVERVGRAVDAKAKAARHKAEAKVQQSSEPVSALKAWCRDCD